MLGSKYYKVYKTQKRLGNSLLRFRKSVYKPSLLSASTLEERVLEILKLTENYRTFYVKSGSIQCPAARRSATDIWRIHNYYFQKIPLRKILGVLFQLSNDRSFKMVSSYCPDVHKRVFILNEYGVGTVYNVDIPDEFGLIFSEWRENKQ